MKHFRVSRLTLTLLMLMGLLFTLIILMQFEGVSEWWTITIARMYHLSFAWLFSLIPFSLMEIIVVTWGVFVAIQLIKSIRFAIKKEPSLFLKSLQSALITLLVMANLYVGTAGMAYRRQHVVIPQFEGDVVYTEYVSIVDYFTDRFNEASTQLSFDEDTGSVINPYSLDELNEVIGEAFLDADLDSTYFTTYTTTVKPLLTSFLYR